MLAFSLAASLLAAGLAAAVLVFSLILPVYRQLQETNQGTLSRIHCSGDSCDLADLVNDVNFISADYVLMSSDHFFVDQRRHPGFWIEFSDPSVLSRFRKPGDWKTRTGEVWRLYSKDALVGDRKIVVVVGIVLAARYLMDSSSGEDDSDDQALIAEAGKILARLRVNGKGVTSLGVQTKADGYEVVDSASQAIVDWGGGIPGYYPPNRRFEHTPLFIDQDGILNAVKIDYTGNLIAISLRKIGSPWLLVGILIGPFLLVFGGAYSLGGTVLKKYLTLLGRRDLTIADALRCGEGQEIEFKRGIVDDEILRSIAAFANTNDGTIFLGVNDDGKITGMEAGAPGQKSALTHKIYGLVRQRIKPIPPVDARFEELRGLVVAKIIVARGDERLYFLDGVIYVRHGDSDVKGEPSVIGRILTQYA